MKATITVGISASGKSTWAREEAKKTGAVITNRDDLRFSLTGAKDWSEYKFNKNIEALITNLQLHTASTTHALGKDIIFADTNLDSSRRFELANKLELFGYDVEVKAFPITLEEAWKRDALRANGVGQNVIYRQYLQWLKFTGRKTYVPNESLPKAVLFDIDGTLAHMVGRKPYDWSKVGTDKVDMHLSSILWMYYMNDYEIILLSGRDGICRPETEEWLQLNNISWDYFFMRQAGDMRKDTIIKEEIFWSEIADKFNVEAVFDDRPSVVRMWHEIGIPKVIAVANQNVEF